MISLQRGVPIFSGHQSTSGREWAFATLLGPPVKLTFNHHRSKISNTNRYVRHAERGRLFSPIDRPPQPRNTADRCIPIQREGYDFTLCSHVSRHGLVNLYCNMITLRQPLM